MQLQLDRYLSSTPDNSAYIDDIILLGKQILFD